MPEFDTLFLPFFFSYWAAAKNSSRSRPMKHIKLCCLSGRTANLILLAIPLKTPFLFKVTKGGDTITCGYVRFETYNCDNDLQNVEYKIGRNGPPPSLDLLFVQYNWTLNASIGSQYLKAILLDSLKTPRDSITVNATAYAATKGWHVSGCSPANTNCRSFCELPAGRILTAFNQSDYPYYSDDQGASWHALKSFPRKFEITKLIATAQNEVFLSVSGRGMFHSADGGTHWEERNSGLPAATQNFYGDIQYTKSGKLFVFTGVGVYLSGDKGLNWHLVSFGLSSVGGFSGASSTSDGTIFAMNNNGLVVSTDSGENWKPVYSLSSTAYVHCLFIDDNDDIYIGLTGSIAVNDGIYVSKDHAQSWTNVYTVHPNPGFDNTLSAMTKQANTYYFYSSSENILMKTTDFAQYNVVTPPVGSNYGRESFQYIVTHENNIILSTEFYGINYYIP